MIEKRIKISNKYGLHTRAALKLINVAKKFHSKIEFINPANQTFDCKSIMALMTLGAKKGTVLNLIVSGKDEEDALEAVVKLINGRFGEEE